MRKSLSEILESKRILVQNAASDNDIKTALSIYGYIEEELQGGVKLYSETANLFVVHAKEKQDVVEANESFYEIRDIAEEDYEDICKLCRVAFRNSPALHNLIPSAIKYSPFSEWKLNALKMYDTIRKNPKALELSLRYGITLEKLQQKTDMLNHLEQLQNKRNIEVGEVQQAIKDRDKKMEELKDYCRDLETIAKIALKDKPQLLEKLGILVRS